MKLLIRGEIVEKNLYNDNYYGTSREALERLIISKNVVLIIDINGGLNLKKIYPETIAIFLYSRKEDLSNRLIERGCNTKREIEDRIKIAKDELKKAKLYDYLVENENGKLEQTCQKVREIMISELQKTFDIKKQL